ncbi:glycosyl transferase [Leisingera sp. SS27]|uniref:glycosyl transferase n=1 Tax=Leisingera sp. SS27 TaxID=2979462 RepID=UPI00232DC418|nr:glycosyl transferase [Leisingera sp. SS27]MDC0660431.1 glycosyl transferase [Leisingera sp. SS27]
MQPQDLPFDDTGPDQSPDRQPLPGSLITLQNILLPEPEICSEETLYFHAEGGAACCPGQGLFQLPGGSRLSFNSYFNLFNLGAWSRACRLPPLFAEITGQGRTALRLVLTRPGGGTETLFRTEAELDPAAPLRIRIPPLDEGLLHLEAAAPEGAAALHGARFAITEMPQDLPRLAVSITTFQREAEVQRTVARLNAFLDSYAFGAHIHVQVVDNGQSAGIAPSRHTTPYMNRNLGGAGGFARGLLEAERGGFSHCLFMDDDAAFHMENILRAYMLLALARDPRTALAGAMISSFRPWEMWESGAWFDGACRPLFNGTDLRDPDAVQAMLFDEQQQQQPATFYGGWWFFAFPVAAAAHYPFPFFVRGDDISFSLANDFRIATLNGVVSFQEDFAEKESPQTLYLDLRNHLIHHLVFGPLERSALGTAKIALRFMMRSLLRFKYGSAEAQLLAWQDVMQGPQFFDAHIDMSARRAAIKALIRNEAWQQLPAAAPDGPGSQAGLSERRLFSRLPRRMRHYFGLFTLNGHLLPFWTRLGDRMVLDISARGTVFPAFGGARLTYLNGSRTRAYTVTQSKRRFFSLAWRMACSLLAWQRGHGRLRAAYRKGYGEMASRAYWEKTLAPPAPDPATPAPAAPPPGIRPAGAAPDHPGSGPHP